MKWTIKSACWNAKMLVILERLTRRIRNWSAVFTALQVTKQKKHSNTSGNIDVSNRINKSEKMCSKGELITIAVKLYQNFLFPSDQYFPLNFARVTEKFKIDI